MKLFIVLLIVFTAAAQYSDPEQELLVVFRSQAAANLSELFWNSELAQSALSNLRGFGSSAIISDKLAQLQSLQKQDFSAYIAMLADTAMLNSFNTEAARIKSAYQPPPMPPLPNEPGRVVEDTLLFFKHLLDKAQDSLSVLKSRLTDDTKTLLLKNLPVFSEILADLEKKLNPAETYFKSFSAKIEGIENLLNRRKMAMQALDSLKASAAALKTLSLRSPFFYESINTINPPQKERYEAFLFSYSSQAFRFEKRFISPAPAPVVLASDRIDYSISGWNRHSCIKTSANTTYQPPADTEYISRTSEELDTSSGALLFRKALELFSLKPFLSLAERPLSLLSIQCSLRNTGIAFSLPELGLTLLFSETGQVLPASIETPELTIDVIFSEKDKTRFIRQMHVRSKKDSKTDFTWEFPIDALSIH